MLPKLNKYPLLGEKITGRQLLQEIEKEFPGYQPKLKEHRSGPEVTLIVSTVAKYRVQIMEKKNGNSEIIVTNSGSMLTGLLVDLIIGLVKGKEIKESWRRLNALVQRISTGAVH